MVETTKRVRVTGQVQGVGFRVFTQSRAIRLGLRGWVRNDPDGSVVAVIAGPQAQVDRLLAELRNGPVGSVVANVTVEDAEATAYTTFEIRR